MSDQALHSVKHTLPCHSPDNSNSQINSDIHRHTVNDGRPNHQQLSRRRRQPQHSTTESKEVKKQTISSPQRQETLRKERQRDILLISVTIFVFLLVVASTFILYHVWKSKSVHSKSSPPPPERSNLSPESQTHETDMLRHWTRKLEALDQLIVDNVVSKSDILLDPALLPFRNGTINERHWKGQAYDKMKGRSDSEFFKRYRILDSFPWEEDEDMSKRKIRKDDNDEPYSGKPFMDYTKPSLYNYPSFRSIKENQHGYPQLSTLEEIFSSWPQDNIDYPPTVINETLQHFDYTNSRELQEAWKYVEHQLPFKLTNVPELLEANLKWTDAYVAEQFGRQRAIGTCQESPTSFFAFFDPRKWKVATMGLPPTRDNDFAFRRWAKHARYADHERLSSQRPHFYWQAGVPKEERYQPKDTWSFLSLDLPSFSTTEPTIICPDPSESNGMQCRFGERGVTAANHFDGGQNMVGMITGAKRYILSPPNQCSKLGIQTERGTALYRHSLLNFDRLPDSKNVASDLEREWLEQAKGAQAVETVLKAGEVLFIPSHWFHYIVSLQKNAQCNVRAGVHVEGNPQFGGQYDVTAEGCR